MKNSQKIIVTGGLGFIGSKIVKKALSLGHKVLNIDSETYASDKNNLTNLSDCPDYTHLKIDINDFALVKSSILDFKPDLLLHLAAESHVDQSISKPQKFIKTNILGTFNLLEASIILKQKYNKPFLFTHISTDEVFGSLGLESELKFNELSKYRPNSPYSASKASSDHLVRAWGKTYNLPYIITHCSNNYGPFQHPEKLIPKIIIKCLGQNTIPIYGNGINVRDWIYVSDHVETIFKIIYFGKKK